VIVTSHNPSACTCRNEKRGEVRRRRWTGYSDAGAFRHQQKLT